MEATEQPNLASLNNLTLTLSLSLSLSLSPRERLSHPLPLSTVASVRHLHEGGKFRQPRGRCAACSASRLKTTTPPHVVNYHNGTAALSRSRLPVEVLFCSIMGPCSQQIPPPPSPTLHPASSSTPTAYASLRHAPRPPSLQPA